MEKVNDVELLGTHTLSVSGGEVMEHPVEALRAALQAQGLRDGSWPVATPLHLARASSLASE